MEEEDCIPALPAATTAGIQCTEVGMEGNEWSGGVVHSCGGSMWLIGQWRRLSQSTLDLARAAVLPLLFFTSPSPSHVYPSLLPNATVSLSLRHDAACHCSMHHFNNEGVWYISRGVNRSTDITSPSSRSSRQESGGPSSTSSHPFLLDSSVGRTKSPAPQPLSLPPRPPPSPPL